MIFLPILEFTTAEIFAVDIAIARLHFLRFRITKVTFREKDIQAGR